MPKPPTPQNGMESPNPSEKKFAAVTRATILSSMENKHVQYIAMADRRAQGLLTISAVITPFALSKLDDPFYMASALVFIFFAGVTIISATMCLTPKHYHASREKRRQLLHFSGIRIMEENEYLAGMAELMEDTRELALEVSRDLYHLSNDVLAPKFRWLRIAYCSFAFGICVSSLVAIYGFLSR